MFWNWNVTRLPSDIQGESTVSWWSDYLARRDSKKKALKNKRDWVSHLPKMSDKEIELELLTSSDLNPSSIAQLECELETRRETRRNILIGLTLAFSFVSAFLSLWQVFWK